MKRCRGDLLGARAARSAGKFEHALRRKRTAGGVPRGGMITANVVVAVGLLAAAAVAALGWDVLVPSVAVPSAAAPAKCEPVYALGLTDGGRTLHLLSRRGTLVVRSVETGGELGRQATNEAVTEMVSAQDGSRLLLGYMDGRAVLQACSADNPLDGATTDLAKHDDEITEVGFSENGRSAVTASRDGAICVWDCETAALVRRWQAPVTRAYELKAALLSQQGTMLAASLGRELIVWDVATGDEVRRMACPAGRINCATFLGEGDRIASAGWNRSLQLWETATGRQLWNVRLKTDTECLLQILSIDGGRQLVTGDLQGQLRLWDAATGRLLATHAAHEAHVSELRIAPDGLTLVSGSYDGTVRLWDAACFAERDCPCSILR